jgi:hypothetical protein
LRGYSEKLKGIYRLIWPEQSPARNDLALAAQVGRVAIRHECSGGESTRELIRLYREAAEELTEVPVVPFDADELEGDCVGEGGQS